MLIRRVQWLRQSRFEWPPVPTPDTDPKRRDFRVCRLIRCKTAVVAVAAGGSSRHQRGVGKAALATTASFAALRVQRERMASSALVIVVVLVGVENLDAVVFDQ